MVIATVVLIVVAALLGVAACGADCFGKPAGDVRRVMDRMIPPPPDDGGKS